MSDLNDRRQAELAAEHRWDFEPTGQVDPESETWREDARAVQDRSDPRALPAAQTEQVSPHYFVRPEPSAQLPSGLTGTLIGDVATEFHSAWGVPPLLTVATALGVATAATKGQTDVVLPSGATFPAALYLAPLADPGTLKSPTLATLSKPLLAAQKGHISEAGPAIGVARARAEALATAIKRKTSDMATALADSKPVADVDEIAITLERLNRELVDLEESGEAAGAHMVVSGADLTYEAVIQRAYVNGGKVALLTAEGGLMENLAGRYSDGSARTEFLNSAFDREPFSGERVSDQNRVIEQPWATLLLVTQPDVMQTMLASDHMRRRGFLQRFWMFNIPTAPYRERHELPSINFDLDWRWDHAVNGVWDTAKRSEQVQLLCGDKAEPLREIERDLIRPSFQSAQDIGNPLLGGWLAKAAMTGTRVAGVIERLENPGSTEISGTSASAAASFTETTIIHQEFLFSTGSRASQSSPRFRVLKWLATREHPDTTDTTPSDSSPKQGSVGCVGTNLGFSTREVHRRFQDQSWCERTEDVKEVLTDLAALGWLTGPIDLTGPQGGRPSETWQPHPELRQHHDRMMHP